MGFYFGFYRRLFFCFSTHKNWVCAIVVSVSFSPLLFACGGRPERWGLLVWWRSWRGILGMGILRDRTL
jgi:hypothetical protein